MADIVQKHMETMTVELENMFCTKLYTAEEIRTIMKKRSDYEYKIHGINKNLQDFKEYILYEQTLLRDVRLRRDKHRIGEKKDTIEHRIIKRIRELYETAIQYFPDNVLLFLQFFKFCKQVNYVNATNNVITKMIQQHPNEEKVWYMAAGWYAYDCKDLATARDLILKGLSIHKEFEMLYKEGIQMELFFISGKQLRGDGQAKQEKDDNDEETIQKKKLCTEKIKVYFKAASENVKNCDFFIEVLNILEKFSFTDEVQKIVIEYLLQKFSDNEITWHKLAQREMQGLHYQTDDNTEFDTTSTKGQLMAAISKYQEGIRKVPRDKKKKLWSLFLDFLLELQHDSFGVANVFKLNCLKKALEDANIDGCLTEKYFIHWLEHASNEEEALQIAEKGTNAIPDSVFLWKARLRYLVLKDNDEEILKTFDKGREALKEKALPLWNALIRYQTLLIRNDEIERIFRKGVKEPVEVSDSLKSQYLEWLAITKDLNSARKAYYVLVSEKPYSKKLHLTMSKLETMEVDINVASCEKVHHLAIEQFGQEDVDVWINYCQFCLDFHKTDLNTKLQRIYDDAIRQLPLALKDEFIERFSTCKEAVAVEESIMKYFSERDV